MSNVGKKLGNRLFRTLFPDEIDVRVGTQTIGGVSLLLYKDARCDQAILDEDVGPMCWQRSHSRDNANCIVSIWDDKKGQWISKEDTGTESNTEKEKGLASDSFKRACTNWGIGRELYTSPFIWVNVGKLEVNDKRKNAKGLPEIKTKFAVSEIDYDDQGNINLLTIVDAAKGHVLYSNQGTRKPVQRVTCAEADDSMPDREAPAKPATAPANRTQVVKSETVPQWSFKAEIDKICHEMDCDVTAFAAMRNSCVAGGICPDIPSSKLTVEQQHQLIDAIRANFLTEK